jgi:hypothetical protein
MPTITHNHPSVTEETPRSSPARHETPARPNTDTPQPRTDRSFQREIIALRRRVFNLEVLLRMATGELERRYDDLEYLGRKIDRSVLEFITDRKELPL